MHSIPRDRLCRRREYSRFFCIQFDRITPPTPIASRTEHTNPIRDFGIRRIALPAFRHKNCESRLSTTRTNNPLTPLPLCVLAPLRLCVKFFYFISLETSNHHAVQPPSTSKFCPVI